MITRSMAFAELLRQMNAPEFRQREAERQAAFLASPEGKAWAEAYDALFADPYVWRDPFEGAPSYE